MAATLVVTSIHAQELVIGPGAEVYLASAGALYNDGLTLMPTTDFTIKGQYVKRDTVPTHPYSRAYIKRTYLFADTPLFSGSIQINYEDDELNGLNEANLKLAIHNGTSWGIPATTTNSPSDNYVLATNISNRRLSELLLTDAVSLPLKWGELSGMRQGASVKIKWSTSQESNISHFYVERSMDGVHWITAIASIPAGKKTIAHTDYEQIDLPGYTGQLYYRIREVDLNGTYAFSKVITVSAENQTTIISVSPNPARDNFIIEGASGATIAQVELRDMRGALIKTWHGNQAHFSLHQLSSGIYYVQIQLASGEVLSKQLSIQQ